MKRVLLGLVAALAASHVHADPQLREEAARLFGRLEAPAATAINSPVAKLGRALFWDTRISLDGKTACASCHPAADWGGDRRPFPIDARGKPTSRHSPTVFNSMTQPKLRWLSDRKDGAEQAEGSMTGSMGFGSKDDAVKKIAELGYAAAFRAAYPDEAEPLNAKNYGRALAAYQASLVTPSAFDRFLAGDDGALDAKQKAGLRAFISTGCAGCHNGKLFGGGMMMKFGLVRDYWLETGSKDPDVGLFAASKKEEDKYVFRVPMLRNVAKTAPYFHDGSVDTLDKAVRVMGAAQLGRKLDDAIVASIVAFFESLTGEVPAHYSAP